MNARSKTRTFALVLGGGGARGLAHIPVLEAIDEMGLKPAAIAGSSIGAAIGAAYAAGMSGREIRQHAIARLHDRRDAWRRVVSARAAAWTELFSVGFGNPVLLDAEKLCAGFLPEAVPDSFARLKIPLTVVTTDFYARSEKTFTTGPLRPAVAASLAIPGLVRPVEIEGRVYVDGAAVNPLPFDRMRALADTVVAVDTTLGPAEPGGIPDPWDALFSTIQLMGQTIVTEKLRHGGPDVVIRPNMSLFRLFDFFAASAILRVADAIKPEVKARLAALVESGS